MEISYIFQSKKNSKVKLNKEMEVKSKNPINSYNSDKKNVECGIFENNLIGQYDEETILLHKDSNVLLCLRFFSM
jgi:hypothetical protein